MSEKFDLTPFLLQHAEVAPQVTEELIEKAVKTIAQINEKTCEQVIIIKQQQRLIQLETALGKIIERFKDKQNLHKDDCFAYQTAMEAFGDVQ